MFVAGKMSIKYYHKTVAPFSNLIKIFVHWKKLRKNSFTDNKMYYDPTTNHINLNKI